MKQKRLWFVAVLLLLVSSAFLTFLSAPVANAEGTGCPRPSDAVDECTVLVATLTGKGALPTNVTVTATRNNPYGKDDSVTLDRPVFNGKTYDSWALKTQLGANSYTSLKGIWGTQAFDPLSGTGVCNPNGNVNQGLYKVVVEQNGTIIGLASSVDLCNGTTKEDNDVRIKKIDISVTTATAPSDKGGIGGTAGWANSINNGTGSCSGDSFINVWGGPDNISQSNPRQFRPDAGEYTTGNTLTPGSGYNVSITCYDSPSTDPGRNTYTDSKSGITVVAGTITPVDFGNTGMSNQGGGQVDVTTCDDKGTKPDAGGNCPSTDTAPTVDCHVSLFNPLSWFICPLTSALETVVSGIDNLINDFLEVKPGQGSYTSTCSKTDQWCSYYKPWSIIRDMSLVLIVIFALIAIVSQALGFEILDAYTIRKVLPRLLIAIIGIALSWPLMMFIINLMNDLGLGVRGLIYAPFSGYKVVLGGGGQFVSSLFLGGAIVGLGFAGLLSFVATAALAAAVAFLVLVLRQMVIVVLVIFAPIAIVCSILPNTQKVWKLWWDSFSRALLMFPIISAFIAIGRVFAAVNSQNAGTINQLVAFTAYFAPYFMIPFAFRLAGGAVATLGGLVNDRSRGAFDRLKKYRGNKLAQNMHDMKTGNRYKGSNPFSKAFNSATRNAANLPNAGFVPWKMRSRMQAASATHEMQEMAEYMEKNADFASIKGNDDYLQATMKNMGGGSKESDWRRYLQAHGYEGRALEQGVAAIRAAKRGVSDEVFEKAAVVANAATGTGWKQGGAASMMESIVEASGGDRHTGIAMLAQMRGMASQQGRLDLAGSGFGNQASVLNSMYDKVDNGEAIDMADVNSKIYDNAIFTKGAGEFTRARGDAIRNMAPQMLDHLKVSHDNLKKAKAAVQAPGGNTTANQAAVTNAERVLAQDLAAFENIHDQLTYSAPENARILADSVYGQVVGQDENGQDMTTLDQIRAFQGGDSAGSRAYRETRRTYSEQQDRNERRRVETEGK